MCDGGKLVSAPGAVGAKPAGKDAANRRYKGSASGEKNAVNLIRFDCSALEQRIDTVVDCGEIVDDPAFEVGA